MPITAACMLQFPSRFARGDDEVHWISVTEDGQRILIFALSNLAVGGQILTSRAVADEFVFLEKAEGAGIIPGREVDLSEGEGVIGIIWELTLAFRLGWE